jgi:transposase-like protein
LKKEYPNVTPLAKQLSREDFSRALDELARAKVGELIQAVLVAEVDEFIQRLRPATSKASGAHRDGYEDERTVTYGSLPVKFRRPRVRGVEAPFVSEVLPPHRRRFVEVDKTLHELSSRRAWRKTASSFASTRNRRVKCWTSCARMGSSGVQPVVRTCECEATARCGAQNACLA